MRLGAKIAASLGLVAGLGACRIVGGVRPWPRSQSPRERVGAAIQEVLLLSDSEDHVDWHDSERAGV